MKKFSNITGQKVGQDPKLVKNERDEFKFKLMDLIDNHLSVCTYGPIDRYLRAGTIKISGKETLVEALMSFMSDRSLKEQNKLLESLKSEIKDWETIDSKMKSVNDKIELVSEGNKTLKYRMKLTSLYENFGSDTDLLMEMVDSYSNKIESNESIRLVALTAEFMSEEGNYPSDVFKQIAEKFLSKLK